MEYHLPIRHGLLALDQVKQRIEQDHPDTFFPIECRYTKQDQAWLSPFQNEDKISIAVHCYYQDPYQNLFADIEPIFRKLDGRPHWGKIHSLKKKDLAAIYPDWEAFLNLRRQLDPQGKFLNDYLKGLFA